MHQTASILTDYLSYSYFTTMRPNFNLKSLNNSTTQINKTQSLFVKNVYEWFHITLKYYPRHKKLKKEKKKEVKPGLPEIPSSSHLQLAENLIFVYFPGDAVEFPNWQ